MRKSEKLCLFINFEYMKKVIFIALTLLSLTTSLVSCYTYETVTKYSYESAQDDYNRRYRGYTRSQIINELGAPDRVVSIDGSSVILIYEKYTSWISRPIDPLGLGIGSYTETTNRIFEEFYIDSNYKCYNVRTNKVKEIPYQETIKKSIFDY